MNLDQIEDLIRRYLAAGMAVVVILTGPVSGAAADAGAAPVTAQPGAVDPVDEEIEIRDGTPGADEAAGPTDDPAPGGADAPADPSDGAADDGAADDGAADAGAGGDGAADDGAGGDGAGGDTADGDTADGDTADAGEPTDDPTPRGDEPGNDEPADDEPEETDPDRRDPTDDDTAPGTAGPETSAPRTTAPRTSAPRTSAPRTTGPRTTGPDPTDPEDPPAGEAATAAERFGWGPPEQADDFRTADLDGWRPYTGPGHQGRGQRSPDALAVDDGVLTISGDARGTTGGACWGGGQRYGRWEARVRAPRADPAYHALLLLWPDADDFPTGGQVDFLELTDPARASAAFHLHFGEDGDQVRSEVGTDATRWHAWAVEWTPEGITGYVDGERWFSSTDPETLPPGPMHLCVQLDFFPVGDAEVRPSRMDVDWVRRYAPDEGPAAPEPTGAPAGPSPR